MFYLRASLPVLLLVAWLMWEGLQLPVLRTGGARVGSFVPEFSLPRLDGSGVVVRDDLPHTPYVLNVWGSWCAACRAEHAYLEYLSTSSNITIVGINYRDNTDSALDWLDRYGNPYLFNIRDSEGQLALDLGVSGAPESFVVGADGTIHHHHIGVLSERVFKDWRVRLGSKDMSVRL